MMPKGVYDRGPKTPLTPSPEVLEPVTMPEAVGRVEQVAKERRRRNNADLDGFTTLRLGLTPEQMAEHKDFDLRWVNDEKNRVWVLTNQDDWDVVEGIEPRPVGTDVVGKPVNAVLLRKPKVYADEDRKAKIENINRRENSVLRAANPEAAWADPDNASQQAGNVYVPQGNSIQRKRAYSP